MKNHTYIKCYKVVKLIVLIVLTIILMVGSLVSCSSTQKMSEDISSNAFAKAEKDSVGKSTSRFTDIGTIDVNEFKLKYTPTNAAVPMAVDNGREVIYVHGGTVEKHYINSKEQKNETTQKKEDSKVASTEDSGSSYKQEIATLERKGMKFIAVVVGGLLIFGVIALIIILWFFNSKLKQFIPVR